MNNFLSGYNFARKCDVVFSETILASSKEVEDGAFGQVYNIGTGINYSINEIAKMIDYPTINIPPRIGETRISQANNQKIKKTFGWQPKMKLEDWINGQK